MNLTLSLDTSFALKNHYPLKLKIILRTFWILAILSVISLLVFYIFQVNSEISARYLIREYEKKLSEILKENKNLEISSSQVDSLENIAALLENLNFEKSGKIKYIRVLNNQVVSR